MLRISHEEYRRRLRALQADVGQLALDIFVVSALESVYYLSGAGFEPLERPFFLLVRSDRAPTLLVPRLEREHMEKALTVDRENILTYWEYPAPPGRGWPDRLREQINGARRVGVEPTLPQEIVQRLGGYEIRTEPLVERLRLVKSEDEVRMIRRAARYADLGVERLLAASYFGATVAEGFAETRGLNWQIVREVDDCDLLNTRIIMATWPAPVSAMPHSIPDLNDRLRQGPHVALVLTRVNGYSAECERTYFTAPPSQDERRAFAAMTEARRLAFGMIRPGLACAELDGRVNDFLRREGFDREDQRLHRTGHGFGLNNHEGPWIAEGSDDRLSENMVVSIEPGVYLPGLGGFRHSDTVLVTKAGHEVLTRVPTGLDTLVLRGWRPLARIKGRLVRRALGLARKAGRSGRPPPSPARARDQASA